METGVVCVLDALGTKGVWSIDDPVSYLQKLSAIHNVLDDIKNRYDSEGTTAKFNFITFSDTIIITAHIEGHQDETLIPLMARAIDGLFSHCLSYDLLMRGALSYGSFIQQDRIIIGPAIDDAAHWHDQAQLVGCLLTPNTTLLCDVGLDRWSRNPYNNYDYSQHVVKYQTPVKAGGLYELYQVNWPLSFHKALKDISQRDTIVVLKESLGKYPIPAEAYKKHENTIEFFRYSLSQ